ncbi:TonB-dependent receptor [Porphyromonas sp. COT-290 OH3588]|uniref:SusC/RagA family TonB-linked outer membrane protein n=1 Tax=Porphyromonas sp. COT-290 OH3588 TaxID=1515617 RepID=UPI00052B67A9|nr:TonB-dependent receptor [Porphyromonas sp. COT-290 OH3588]KGO01606.1 membrane receptor RagA [Porphyromonas sp. COT-290 OH3588]
MKQGNIKARAFWFVLATLLFVHTSWAQDILLKGAVVDSKGESIIGASIRLKGNPSVGTVTDFDGNFQLKAPKSETLLISYIGYVNQEIAVATAVSPLRIVLQEDNQTLKEVVVIGYGSMQKKDLTGSITSINEKNFQKGAISTPGELLVGKVAGVQITPDGSPGGASKIRIRGGASLNASNDPLIVIDGVPIDNSAAAGAPSVLSSINPQDIASMNVLKDASATAIYGSRASNGVIIITTKRGKMGQDLQINFSTTNSIAHASKLVDVLGADAFRKLVTEIDPSRKTMLGSANTNWQREIYQAAFGTDNNLSVSGAVGMIPFRASIGYYDQNGVLKTDNMKRVSTGISLNPRFLDNHLAIDANLKVSGTKNRFADRSAIGDAVTFDPTQPIFADGFEQFGGYFTWMNGDKINALSPVNPVAKLNLRDNNSNVLRSLGSMKIDYQTFFLPELRFSLNLGYDYTHGKGKIFVPEQASWEWNRGTTPGKGGTNNEYEQKKVNLLLDFYANYAKEIESLKSRIDVMAGYSYQDWKTTDYKFADRTASGEVVSKPIFPVDYPQNTLVSGYARLNYSLMNRYLFTATVRADGSSRFSKENRWGIFPSLALAWRMKEEGFLKDVDAINDLKLRLGYGVTGQQDGIANYSYLMGYYLSQNTAMYQFGDKFYNMYRPAAYDKDIKWEQTETYNVGLDYAFLNNRISGTVDVYYKNTKDLLNEVPIPAGSNFSNKLLTNVGNITNKGIEFTINATPVQTKDFNWEVSMNFTINDTKITKLNLTEDPNYLGVLHGGVTGGTGNNIQIHSVGHTPGSFFVFKQLYDPSGKPIEGAYADLNGDGLYNEKDRYHFNSPNPDLFMGFSTSLTYGKWSLSTALRASFGNYIYDNISSFMAVKNEVVNPNSFLRNTTSEIYKSGFATGQYMSDYYIHNASFLRMDNLTLGYDFGKIFGKTNLRATATVQNVFTLSGYKGMNPEHAIDMQLYPVPRTYSLNLSLTL